MSLSYVCELLSEFIPREFCCVLDSGILSDNLLMAVNDPQRNWGCEFGYCESSSQSASVPGMARSISMVPAKASSVIE